MDFTEYTDDELEALRLEVLAERERRARVANVPAQIEALTRAAVEAGAEPEAIRAAVEQGLSPEELAALKGGAPSS